MGSETSSNMAKTKRSFHNLGARHHLIIIFLLLLIASPVFADNIIYTTPPSFTYCINATDSAYEWVYWDDITGPAGWETHYKNITCTYGCEANTGVCYKDPNEISVGNLGIILVLPIIAFIFMYYATKLDEKTWFITMLLLGMAFWLLISDAALLIEMAESLNQSDAVTVLTRVYGVVMWTSIVIIFYFLIGLLIKTISILQGGGARA